MNDPQRNGGRENVTVEYRCLPYDSISRASTRARLRCRAEKLECGLSARLRNSIAEGSAFLADRAMQVSPVALSEVHARS
jgi:hypothetical protein